LPILPPRQVCQICLSDEDYEVTLSGDGTKWIYTCNAPKHGESPYVWSSRVASPDRAAREGIMSELGLYDDLLACVHDDEGSWAEHGVVEHRYKILRPTVYFGDLIPTYGHTAQKHRSPGRSASLMLAMAMSQLRREGLLEYRTWPPTGFWAKNSTISYWAKPPPPPDSERLTWKAFALDEGLDPMVWDLSLPGA
jgi:hypothetical protein